tara:strand:- start:10709 stop:11056 length:348 start_codon:yes stop_codon:yes gene_type:complete
MASTRNNNMKSDYKLQQYQSERMRNYAIPLENNTIIKPSYPEFGINSQRAPSSTYSHNATDIESELFGIGTTNLVKEKEQVIGRMKNVDTVKFIDRMELILPKFESLTDQRPQFN